MSDREYQRQLMAEKRAKEQSVVLPAVADPARRLRAEADSFTFLETYFADRFDEAWTSDRRLIVEAIDDISLNGGDQAIAAPRGEGKTSIAECSLGVGAIVNGRIQYGVILSSTGKDAEQVLENIKREYETNELLIADYPEVCVPIVALDGAPQRAGKQRVNGERTRLSWSGDRIVFPTVTLAWCPKCYYPEPFERKGHLECPKCKVTYQPWKSKASGSIFMTRGMDAAIRGLRVGNRRPDIVLIDDPETEQSSRSESEIKSRKNRIEKDVGGLGRGSRKVSRLMLTTIQTVMSLSAEYTDPKRRPGWGGKRLQLVKSWPDAIDLWQTYVDLKNDDGKTGTRANEFYEANREAMDEGAEVSNPLRFDTRKGEVSAIQSVFNDVAEKGWEYVNCELQNSPTEQETEESDHLTIGIVTGSNLDYVGRCSRLGAGVYPADTKQLVAFIDVQRDRIYFEVVAFKDGQRRYVIDSGCEGKDVDNSTMSLKEATIQRLVSLKNKWDELPYESEDGSEQKVPDITLVDSGDGVTVDAVYEACLMFPTWFPSKGDGKYKSPQAGISKSTLKSLTGDPWHFSAQVHAGRPFVLVVFDANVFKHRTKASWKIAPEGSPAGSVHLHGNDPTAHRDFALQICSARFERWFDEKTGQWKEKWIEGKNNHYWDTDVGTLVGYSVSITLAIRRSSKESPAEPADTTPVRRQDERRSGFVRKPSPGFGRR